MHLQTNHGIALRLFRPYFGYWLLFCPLSLHFQILFMS
jgi:hypothetical protein